MPSRRGKQARTRALRRGGKDRLPITPYLGAFDFPLAAEVHGDVRKFRRTEGLELVETQRAIVRQMNEAERQLPELLEKIRACALASDPLMLFSRLHVFDAVRRSNLPGATMFGSDAVLEFYGGLVTAMPVEQVLSQLGADDHPQVLYDLDALLRNYGIAENVASQGRTMVQGSANGLTSAQHMLEFEHRFDRMFGYPDRNWSGHLSRG